MQIAPRKNENSNLHAKKEARDETLGCISARIV